MQVQRAAQSSLLAGARAASEAAVRSPKVLTSATRATI